MIKLKTLLLVLVATTSIVFGQIVSTKSVFSSFTGEHVMQNHAFNFSFGEEKNVAWYHSHEFNDVFERVTPEEFGTTKDGQFYKVADFIDSKGFSVIIQYFPYDGAVRVIYPHNMLILEFFE